MRAMTDGPRGEPTYGWTLSKGGRLGALNGRDGHVPNSNAMDSAPTPGVGRGTSRATACFSCYARLSGVLYDQQVIIGLFRVEGSH